MWPRIAAVVGALPLSGFNDCSPRPTSPPVPAFGVEGHTREYLEMLECAYPNAFAGKMRRLKTKSGMYFREHSSYLSVSISAVYLIIRNGCCVAGVLEVSGNTNEQQENVAGGVVQNNRNPRTAPSSVMSALQQVASEICKGSSDSLMYNEFIVPVFWSRYRAMKNKPESCCRRRTS
jgi:hypothetical protein